MAKRTERAVLPPHMNIDGCTFIVAGKAQAHKETLSRSALVSDDRLPGKQTSAVKHIWL
jgi:hypothetical protein